MKSHSPDRSYYLKLRGKAQSFHVNLNEKKWCDLWHTHFDWEGFGNLSWFHRRQHLKILLLALARARKELLSQQTPFQLFATIHPNSSADDAIYIHTPNPNGSEFPLTFENAKPIASLPPLLNGRVNQNHYMVLKATGYGNPHFILLANGT